MSDGQLFPVPEAWARRAHMDAAGYDAAWKRVEADPSGYLADVAERLDWIEPFTHGQGRLLRRRGLPHPLVSPTGC